MQRNRAGKRPGPRWWPFVLIVSASLLLLILTWYGGDQTRQERVMLTGAILILATLVTLIWSSFFSRFTWRSRLAVIGSLLLAGLLGKALFRVQGVSGDLVPILEWRWSGPSEFASSGGRLSMDPEAVDYPQFLGPNRDAVLPAVSISDDWSATPPRQIWRRPIGEGWSAFAVRGRVAVTQEQEGDDEQVVAYDFESGSELWRYSYPARYETVIAGVGPRSIPTIDSGRVYTTGATGILNCLDLQSGELIWSREFVKEAGGSIPVWGYSGSPLVFDNLVVVNSCGNEGKSLTAYDKTEGRLVWQGGEDSCGYSSPQIRTIAGVRQIITFNHSSLSTYSPEDGSLLWTYPWSREQPNVSQPLILPGDRLFASSGYGIGGKLFQIQAEGESVGVSLLWETPRLKAKFTNVLYFEGYLYGLDDGVMVCLDPSNGQRRWKKGRYGHGQVILVGDLLLVQSETGEIFLLKPNPDEHTELARFQALEGKTWNPPALVGRFLLVRNHLEAALYELPAAS